MDLITYRGRVVAAVGFRGLHLGPELASRPAGDPELVFVAFMCAFALEVRLGRLPGPYEDERAALFARFALIDDEEFLIRVRWCDAALARRFRVPVAEIARKRGNLLSNDRQGADRAAGGTAPPFPARAIEQSPASYGPFKRASSRERGIIRPAAS